jgi:hypothetical protein
MAQRPQPIIVPGGLSRQTKQTNVGIDLGAILELTGAAEAMRRERRGPEAEALATLAQELNVLPPETTQPVQIGGAPPVAGVAEQAPGLLAALNLPTFAPEEQRELETAGITQRVDPRAQALRGLLKEAAVGSKEGLAGVRQLVLGTAKAGAVGAAKAPQIKEDEKGRLRFTAGPEKGQLVFKDVLTPTEAANVARKKVKGKSGPEAETALRAEFVKSASDFVKVRDSFGRIRAAAEDPSAAGDLALIFNFMKTLDPGSVVRESEFATAQNAAGVPDRTIALYNRVLRGERLAPNTREDFVNKAEVLFRSQEKIHNKRISEFQGLARRNGVSPENVTIDLGLPEEAAATTGTIADDGTLNFQGQQIAPNPDGTFTLPDGTVVRAE